MKKTQVKEYRFGADDFYRILKEQNEKCFLTGRDLYPVDALCEHIIPLRKGGRHEFKNICIVITAIAKLKRYYTEEEIVHIASDIIGFKGAKYGFRITRKNKKRK